MNVSEIMTAGAATCVPSSNLAEAAEVLWKHDCGIIPVVDPAKGLVGVITDRDIAIALGTGNRRASEMLVQEAMTKHVQTCHPDEDPKRALALMHAHKVRRLPVVGRDGEVRGIVSIDDVFRVARLSGGITFAEVGNVMKRLCERGPQVAQGPALAGTAPRR